MTTNAPLILSAAICKLHDGAAAPTSRRLNVVVEHQLDAADTPAASSVAASIRRLPPPVADVLHLIERGADLGQSHADRIVLDSHVLYYSNCVAPDGNTVYLCLADPPPASPDWADLEIFHAKVASEFLKMLQHGVSSDTDLTHAISLPNLRAANPPHDRNHHLLPRFIQIVTSAHQTAMSYAQQNNTMSDSSASKSSAPSSARIAELQRQVADVKTVMSDNVVRIMERGERLENLDSRTEALHASSQNFKTTARRVQRNMCLKNLKWTIILGLLCTLMVLFILYTVLREFGVFGGGGK